MSRKAKREIARARRRNADSRVANKWTMQRMAVDLGERDTEIQRLRSILAAWKKAQDERDAVALVRAQIDRDITLLAFEDRAALTTGQTAGKSDD